MANNVNVTQKPDWQLHDNGFQHGHVTLKEVTDLTKEIDCYKDSLYCISTLVLKDSFTVLAYQLQYLFNVSLKDSVFPREWAKGFINILPKGQGGI